MGQGTSSYSFPDHHQNFWQLSCIQVAGSGIPVFIVGGQIAAQYGPGAAITSVILGNLILWMVGLGIISMAIPGRANALQNISQYLGKPGGLFAALFLILSFLAWYILQINSANVIITHLFSHNENQLRFGAAMGAFIALLSIGGIQLIKKYCVFVFPFLLLFAIYSIATSLSHFHIDSIWNFSFLGIIAIVSVNICGIVNLPTFFRHARSQYDSYLGLTLMLAFTSLFQIYTVILGLQNESAFASNSTIYSIFISAFVILSLIAVNLSNIYLAAASWEMLLPHRRSNKEFVIVGLLGTMAYTFLQVSAPMQFILGMAENFIASLSTVLLLSFLIKTFEEHRPRPYEKSINFSCWFLGAIVGTVLAAGNGMDPSKALAVSFVTTSIAFLCVVYIKETCWAAIDIINRKTDEQT
jgi:cytosine permease